MRAWALKNMAETPRASAPVILGGKRSCSCGWVFDNGEYWLLLTTLLLYRNGFYVGKYISLEAKIAKNKDLYYDALGASQIGWHEGKFRRQIYSGGNKAVCLGYSKNGCANIALRLRKT